MCLANAEAKSYVLVSQLDHEVYSKYVEDKEAAPLSGFAFTIISLIHLAGGKIPEGKGRGKLFALVRKTSWSDVPELCQSLSRGPLASVEAVGFEE